MHGVGVWGDESDRQTTVNWNWNQRSWNVTETRQQKWAKRQFVEVARVKNS